MNAPQNFGLLNDVLHDVAADLDVPASKYEEAKQHYDAVGEWLGSSDSALARFQPVIYPQGSFALGTAVRPLGDDDYDVDAVCLLQMTQDQVTQQDLKQLVGDRLAHPSSRYKAMLDPKEGGRRCWTIKYADGSKFHLDVLPAIPDPVGIPEIDPVMAKDAILITCKDTWDDSECVWPRSNPKGYVTWFKERMATRLMEAKRVLAMEAHAEVEEIEDFRVRTPLQRLIQLFKRHRDQRYNGDEDKPISIIITTLAATAYDNEADLADAILNVVPRMRALVKQRDDGVWWIPNPVNPHENFADKWDDNPRKAQLFFEWLDAVESEHRFLLTNASVGMESMLTEAYGERAVRGALAKNASRFAKPSAPTILVPKKTGVAMPVTTLAAGSSKPWSE